MGRKEERGKLYQTAETTTLRVLPYLVTIQCLAPIQLLGKFKIAVLTSHHKMRKYRWKNSPCGVLNSW